MQRLALQVESETVSKSSRVSCPTPAAARYCAAAQPSPPRPTTSTRAATALGRQNQTAQDDLPVMRSISSSLSSTVITAPKQVTEGFDLDPFTCFNMAAHAPAR